MLTMAAVTVQERLIEQLSQAVSAAMLAEGKQKRAAIRQLMCKVQEIRTTLLKHLAKEEEQLFPLLLKHFTYSEQARALPNIPTSKHPLLNRHEQSRPNLFELNPAGSSMPPCQPSRSHKFPQLCTNVEQLSAIRTQY